MSVVCQQLRLDALLFGGIQAMLYKGITKCQF